jgi:predicted DNA-binding transcriptional regulator YafY
MPHHDFGTRLRIVLLIRLLSEGPRQYTIRQIAEKYQVSPDTIKGDIEILRNAGYVVDHDEKYRYFFREEKPYTYLKDLLHFNAEDQVLLEEAIDQIAPHTRRGDMLKRKLASLYDYYRLGHAYLRKPYLSKVNLLLQAKSEKRQVLLQGYKSSNSNRISDRLVEPFHPSPPDDVLHAYDLEKKALRHYRISRILRVKLLDEPWQHEGKHVVLPTDPFRIVDRQQEMVHLRMKVGAYNELVERYPLTRAYLTEAEEDIYDFQCMVNHRFIGLTNFILGYHHQLVEVLAPESLLKHLQKEVEKLKFY